jgi:hypothetical protein
MARNLHISVFINKSRNVPANKSLSTDDQREEQLVCRFMLKVGPGWLLRRYGLHVVQHEKTSLHSPWKIERRSIVRYTPQRSVLRVLYTCTMSGHCAECPRHFMVCPGIPTLRVYA